MYLLGSIEKVITVYAEKKNAYLNLCIPLEYLMLTVLIFILGTKYVRSWLIPDSAVLVCPLSNNIFKRKSDTLMIERKVTLSVFF